MFKELRKDEAAEGARRQASRPLAYTNYYLRASNEFLLKDVRHRKTNRLDANNMMIAVNPMRKKKKYKNI
jgi:hypothetical protein